MVSESESARVCAWLDAAVADGATIRAGGTARAQPSPRHS